MRRGSTPIYAVGPTAGLFASNATIILGLAVACAACVTRASAQSPPIDQAPTTTNPAAHPVIGRVLRSFAPPGTPPLRMPTDVAVAPDGVVFIADGVHERIVRFAADGHMLGAIDRVGELPLSNPVGLAFDERGRLYIADSGRGEVLVVTLNDSSDDRADAAAADFTAKLERTLKPPASSKEHRPDVTGVAAAPDGSTVWIADNENHRIIRHDVESGAQTVMGRKGESVGQLQYPFLAALHGDGRVLVVDVINARVSAFSEAGNPTEPVGGYGVDLGQLYRPKGIAVDPAGNIWVSDGTLDVVQVFTADGTPIDVLRGDDGKPMKFAFPMGLDVRPVEDTDRSFDLFVTELRGDRVTKVRASVGDRPVRSSPQRRVSIVGGQARACTTCHIEWIEPFSRGLPTTIAHPPPTTDDEPAASRSDMCLSCHDASVSDSRGKVWDAHGHRTGIQPPPEMKVPVGLPLVKGAIACRTCHSAHTTGQFSSDFATAVFLRVENRASELCIGCHADKTRGPELGTHPIGGMPWPVPQSLLDAGAKIGPNPRELTCQVCHTPHGSKVDHLLVMGTGSNQLCMECHDQMRPGMFRDGPHTEHPLRPPVNAEQAAAIMDMGTKLGDEERLICLSCHKLHHGKGERFMLADDFTDSRLCLRCHSDKNILFGSMHDLRTNFPAEKNRLGMTPESGGPCSACHMFHRYARSPEISALDPGGGKCITCHQSGRCAESKTLGAVNHPDARCVDCHNPHDPHREPFLRDKPETMCMSCHQEQAHVAGGPHDYRMSFSRDTAGSRADWPPEGLAKQDQCLVCHRPHGDERTGLLRFADGGAGPDAGCRACHPNHLWGAAGPWAAVHPQTMKPGMSHGALPLTKHPETSPEEPRPSGRATPPPPSGDPPPGAIGCRTCHNLHASPTDNPSLLRLPEGAKDAGQMCAQCHTDAQHVSFTGHGRTSLTAAGMEAKSCSPCHTVHAEASALGARRLIPRNLFDPATPDAQRAGEATALCTACHRQDGPARPPAVATHPDVIMAAVAQAAATAEALPLFDAHGAPSPAGKIACLTCHLPHGRSLEGAELERVAASPPEMRRSMRLMLRDFATPNACTTCHGADALRRFLYFHDPQRRGGPLAPVRGAAAAR